MQEQGQKLFRKESLERLSSPEQLDQLMRVVGPKAWLPLATLGTLLTGAVIWSVVGRIPITVAGQGVLISPRQVVQLQSPGSGQIQTLNIKVGDVVKKGDVLATVEQADLQKQLQQEQAKLAELQGQNQSAGSLQGQRLAQDKLTSLQQRLALEQNLRDTQNLTPVLREKSVEALQQDRLNIGQRLQALQFLLPTLKERWEKRQEIAREGAISADLVLQSRQEYLSNLATLSDAASQLKQLDVKEADAKREYLNNLNSITDIKAKLRALDSSDTLLAQQNLENSTTRQNQIQEVKRNVARLKLQLENSSRIVSQYDGRILELAAVPGQVLGAGSSLGSINIEHPGDKLMSLTYFTVEAGKKIKPGMPLQVTPVTVKRERFGGILGQVTTVSPFAPTLQGVDVLVGNEEIAKNLTANGQQVEVFAALQEDPSTASGFKWSSSKGPSEKISAGTTTQVRVKVGERAPISYVIPLLKSVTGVN